MASEDIRGTYQPSPIASKLALITGATGGIGAATARLFASRGAHLALHYHTNASGASKLQASLTAQYPDLRVRTYRCDLADFDAVRAMHAQIVDEMGDVEVLYNNAAAEGTIMGIKGKIEDVKMEEVEGCWRSNVGAAFLLTQLCVPPMEKKGYGRVVFCSSIAAATGGVVGPHYASSKSALHGIMHWVANQYVRSGITCNAVAPALIANTQMFHTPTEAHRNLIPMGRFGQPEEIAQAVELLVTNSYMTNKIITVDGGLLPSSLA